MITVECKLKLYDTNNEFIQKTVFLNVTNGVCRSRKIRIKALMITYDAEGGCVSLDAAQLARLAVVHRIRRHQVRQQPRV